MLLEPNDGAIHVWGRESQSILRSVLTCGFVRAIFLSTGIVASGLLLVESYAESSIVRLSADDSDICGCELYAMQKKVKQRGGRGWNLVGLRLKEIFNCT